MSSNVPLGDEQAMTGEYLSRLLSSIDEGMRELILLCALPHYFDNEILDILNKTHLASAVFLERIQHYSFVEESAGRFRYHDLVRELFSKQLHRDHLEFYVTRHSELASYFVRTADARANQYWPNMVEAVYHSITAKDQGAIVLLGNLYDRAEDTLSLGLCEHLIKSAREAAAVDPDTISWIDYYDGRLSLVRGAHLSALEVFELLASRASLPRVLLYRVLRDIGVVSGRMGSLEKAIEYNRAALTIAEELNDMAGVMDNLYQLGRNHKRLGDFGAAISWHTKALSVSQADDTRAQRAAILFDLGNVHMYKGRWKDAEASFLESQRLYRGLSSLGEMEAEQRIGWLMRMVGKLDLALEIHLRAIKYFEQFGVVFPLAEAIHSTGNVFRDQRDYIQGYEMYRRALQLFEQLSSRRHVAIVQRDLAFVETMLGRYPEANQHLQNALVILREINDKGAYIEGILVAGLVAWTQEDLLAAHDRLSEAIIGSRELGNKELEARCLFGLSRLHLRQRSFELLHRTGLELQRIGEEYGGFGSIARSELILGEAAMARGDAAQAKDHFLTALIVGYQWNRYQGHEIAEFLQMSIIELREIVGKREALEISEGLLTDLSSLQQEIYSLPIQLLADVIKL